MGASCGPGSRPTGHAADGVDGATRFDPSREAYLFTNGWTMRREGSGVLWVLRNLCYGEVDRDRYRHDLISRHGLTVSAHYDPRPGIGAAPCAHCGRPLQNFEDEGGNHPMGGVEFTTGGHYGTTVFDPMDASRIAINICDPCLIAMGRLGFVRHYKAGERRRCTVWRPASADRSPQGGDGEAGSIEDESAVRDSGDAQNEGS